MPTRSQALRSLAGLPEFTFAEGYPSAFVVRLLRLLAECPVEAETTGVLGPWMVDCGVGEVVLGAVSCAWVVDDADAPVGLARASESALGVSGGSMVTVGYEVAPSREGQGYATEMLRLVCGHLLAQPGIARVCADTEADHAASRRVMEKAGLTWRRDEAECRDGREVTIAHYAVDGPVRNRGRAHLRGGDRALPEIDGE